ncbi:MAG: glycosyltransferase family 39 protein [Steroidobacter sp.]
MLFNNAANAIAQSPIGAPRRAFSDIVHAVANLFETTRPLAREQVAHFLWLATLLIAGTVVRFWGLDAVGLHGDEETMAMAVRHIVIDGRPILPSGMFYPRGMTQLYFMALSVSFFGESEWSLRLPSAICGVALIGLSYIVGRRFLRPQWNLALAATVAFLPELIIYSQTARMYIFMVTCVMASMACLFEWERTDRTGWLVGAAAALIAGIDLHALTVAVILMFLLPGLLQGDARKFVLGAAAALAVGVGFVLIDGWVNSKYPVPPPEFAAELGAPPWERSWAPPEFALTFDIALWISGLAIGFLALHVARAATARPAAFGVAVLLLAGVVLQLALFYHLAALAYLAGVVLARRYGSPQVVSRLILFVIAAAVMALIHASLLASTPGSIIKLVGAMVGQPSVWPYVRVADLSEAAGVLTAALLLWGLYQFASTRRMTDYWLLAFLGVFAPLFALGLFAWNVPPRYTSMSLLPMLLSAYAFAQRGTDWLLANMPRMRARAKTHAVAAALTAVCAINPTAAGAVVNAGYRLHPDHKGAADFMHTQQLTDEDIVLAEDVLQQTYYLGSVDYWLIGPQVARRFVKGTKAGVVDFYTGTPVIVTTAMLDELLQENHDKRIFVIGTGEGWSGGERRVRGEMHAAIESKRFSPLYTGRDGLTRVLRAVPGAVSPSATTATEAEADEAALAEDVAAAARGEEVQEAEPASAPATAE